MELACTDRRGFLGIMGTAAAAMGGMSLLPGSTKQAEAGWSCSSSGYGGGCYRGGCYGGHYGGYHHGGFHHGGHYGGYHGGYHHGGHCPGGICPVGGYGGGYGGGYHGGHHGGYYGASYGGRSYGTYAARPQTTARVAAQARTTTVRTASTSRLSLLER